MLKILRYKSRIRVRVVRGRDEWVNPTVYASNDKVLFDWSEPVWLFHWRRRVFCEAGEHHCPERAVGPTHGLTGPDKWIIGPDNNRTCSYCGSLHFDDFWKLVTRALDHEDVGIEPSNKAYKIYVRQAGVRNASEGAVKFYTSHMGGDLSEIEQAIYSRAVEASRERYRSKLDELFPEG